MAVAAIIIDFKNPSEFEEFALKVFKALFITFAHNFDLNWNFNFYTNTLQIIRRYIYVHIRAYALYCNRNARLLFKFNDFQITGKCLHGPIDMYVHTYIYVCIRLSVMHDMLFV